VVALKHSEGIKHKVLLQEQIAYKHWKSLQYTPSLFSVVFLSILSTQNNISWASYLYTNSKQDNSTFKCEGGCGRWCEGGWRHAAGGWRLWTVVWRRLATCGWWLAAGRWQLVAAFLDLLDGLSLIQQKVLRHGILCVSPDLFSLEEQLNKVQSYSNSQSSLIWKWEVPKLKFERCPRKQPWGSLA